MSDELLSQDEINALLEGSLAGGSDDGGGGDSPGLTQAQLEALEDLAGMFSDATTGVIGMLAGREVSVQISEIGEKGQSDVVGSIGGNRNLLFSVRCDGFDDAPVSVVMNEGGVVLLADLMMGGEGKDLPDEANELFVNAAQEGLSQVVGSAMTSLSGKLKGRKAIPTDPASEVTEDDWLLFPNMESDVPVWYISMEVTIEGLDSFKSFISVPSVHASAFADALIGEQEVPAPSASQPSQGSPTEAPPQRPAQQQAPRPSGGGGAGMSQPPSGEASPPVDVRPAQFSPLQPAAVDSSLPSNIGLIADIPVRVTVELGRTRKSVGEVLSFAPGSVIELDKMAGEPVDVLVNGKLIAKGEVVVIDENFGVRVTEILNVGEKIQSIGS
ncbi:flagellar motor switch protein FliN [Dethiosulfovibrio peptidovorans DSM 11002]|uniref:Flagellar motor switch protein FliN n=1 Tax=Dethiosulfovibrio peptidovorans DSM 11002 TaxID=469381 RepID=D2Z3K7_9BACT|nr:flagellar motor switch protein FliN [Dethiosulfovibrio peptidovorans]EFC90313.1 flagellar motor switch protein FliN [Dethiosulfovibrio peptidovorans DSM 11002]